MAKMNKEKNVNDDSAYEIELPRFLPISDEEQAISGIMSHRFMKVLSLSEHECHIYVEAVEWRENICGPCLSIGDILKELTWIYASKHGLFVHRDQSSEYSARNSCLSPITGSPPVLSFYLRPF